LSGTPRIARVLSRRALSPRVSELVLSVPGQPPFRWRAGQYLILHAAAESTLSSEPLPYSIASFDDGREPATLALAIGPGSGAELLAPVGPGAQLFVDGPFGSFTLGRAPGALLVGAGTGVAPLRAHLFEWLAHESEAPVWLLAGARTEQDLLWHSELAALAQRAARFHYEPVLSQPSPGWRGRIGRVQEHLPDLVSRLPADALARVCGAVGMVESSLSLLGELGVPPAHVSAESY
jgi:CDP-4-dehydro-6-deoxyglucose reductase